MDNLMVTILLALAKRLGYLMDNLMVSILLALAKMYPLRKTLLPSPAKGTRSTPSLRQHH
jgi:hypothetical protein